MKEFNKNKMFEVTYYYQHKDTKKVPYFLLWGQKRIIHNIETLNYARKKFKEDDNIVEGFIIIKEVDFDYVYKNIKLEYITIPNPMPDGFVEYLLKRGMIPKKDLEDGVTYCGMCRNAEEAIWNAEKQKFIYKRTKFNYTFDEDINHPEDDNGYDLFIPIKKL